MNVLVLDAPFGSMQQIGGQIAFKVRPWDSATIVVCMKCGSLLTQGTEFWVVPTQYPVLTVCQSCSYTLGHIGTPHAPTYSQTGQRDIPGRRYYQFNNYPSRVCACGLTAEWVHAQYGALTWLCGACVETETVVRTLAVTP